MVFTTNFMMGLAVGRTLSDAVITSSWLAAIFSLITFILNRFVNTCDAQDRLSANLPKTEIEEQEKISCSEALRWLMITIVFYLYALAVTLVASLLLNLLWRGSLQRVITGSLYWALHFTIVFFSVEFLWKDKSDA